MFSAEQRSKRNFSLTLQSHMERQAIRLWWCVGGGFGVSALMVCRRWLCYWCLMFVLLIVFGAGVVIETRDMICIYMK